MDPAVHLTAEQARTAARLILDPDTTDGPAEVDVLRVVVGLYRYADAIAPHRLPYSGGFSPLGLGGSLAAVPPETPVAGLTGPRRSRATAAPDGSVLPPSLYERLGSPLPQGQRGTEGPPR